MKNNILGFGIYRNIYHCQAKGCVAFIQIKNTGFYWAPRWFKGKDCAFFRKYAQPPKVAR